VKTSELLKDAKQQCETIDDYGSIDAVTSLLTRSLIRFRLAADRFQACEVRGDEPLPNPARVSELLISAK
jgi:hypothetical protein